MVFSNANPKVKLHSRSKTFICLVGRTGINIILSKTNECGENRPQGSWRKGNFSLGQNICHLTEVSSLYFLWRIFPDRICKFHHPLANAKSCKGLKRKHLVHLAKKLTKEMMEAFQSLSIVYCKCLAKVLFTKIKGCNHQPHFYLPLQLLHLLLESLLFWGHQLELNSLNSHMSKILFYKNATSNDSQVGSTDINLWLVGNNFIGQQPDWVGAFMPTEMSGFTGLKFYLSIANLNICL